MGDQREDLYAAGKWPAKAEPAWTNIETAEVEFLNNLAEKGGLADPIPGMLRHCARLLGAKLKNESAPTTKGAPKVTTLLRLTGASGRTIIYSLDSEMSEKDARDEYMDETGFDAFESSQRFTFDQCEMRELTNWADTGEP